MRWLWEGQWWGVSPLQVSLFLDQRGWGLPFNLLQSVRPPGTHPTPSPWQAGGRQPAEKGKKPDPGNNSPQRRLPPTQVHYLTAGFKHTQVCTPGAHSSRGCTEPLPSRGARTQMEDSRRVRRLPGLTPEFSSAPLLGTTQCLPLSLSVNRVTKGHIWSGRGCSPHFQSSPDPQQNKLLPQRANPIRIRRSILPPTAATLLLPFLGRKPQRCQPGVQGQSNPPMDRCPSAGWKDWLGWQTGGR